MCKRGRLFLMLVLLGVAFVDSGYSMENKRHGGGSCTAVVEVPMLDLKVIKDFRHVSKASPGTPVGFEKFFDDMLAGSSSGDDVKRKFIKEARSEVRVCRAIARKPEKTRRMLSLQLGEVDGDENNMMVWAMENGFLKIFLSLWRVLQHEDLKRMSEALFGIVEEAILKSENGLSNQLKDERGNLISCVQSKSLHEHLDSLSNDKLKKSLDGLPGHDLRIYLDCLPEDKRQEYLGNLSEDKRKRYLHYKELERKVHELGCFFDDYHEYLDGLSEEKRQRCLDDLSEDKRKKYLLEGEIKNSLCNLSKEELLRICKRGPVQLKAFLWMLRINKFKDLHPDLFV